MARLSVGGATDPRRVAALPFSGEGGGGRGKIFTPAPPMAWKIGDRFSLSIMNSWIDSFVLRIFH